MYFLIMFINAEKPPILPQNAGKCVPMKELISWIGFQISQGKDG